LRKTQVSEDDAHTDGIASSVERGEILSMSSARGDSGLATADVMDAGMQAPATKVQ
jgi:hypothetical protein